MTIIDSIPHAILGISGIFTANASKSKFANVNDPSIPHSSTGLVIFVLLVLLILEILLLIATYKLTNSIFETILCFLFGAIYLFFAHIYYGFSGYKYIKVK